VDPNEGDPRDSILVKCDMETKATCILPQPERSPEITHKSDDTEIWLGDISEGMKVNIK